MSLDDIVQVTIQIVGGRASVSSGGGVTPPPSPDPINGTLSSFLQPFTFAGTATLSAVISGTLSSSIQPYTFTGAGTVGSSAVVVQDFEAVRLGWLGRFGLLSTTSFSRVRLGSLR